ncbi:MAG: ubiquinol-cytochrome C chaperone family protein [Xanthobacteraceae bacterium]
MIFPLMRRSRRVDTIPSVYGVIVAQARSALFYRGYCVPDTVEGRLGMIVLHLALVLRRLAVENAETREFGQRVFDHFCQDMDDNLREMGVGDLAVPRHMRRIGEGFYGQVAAYDRALASADAKDLEQALRRNVFGGRSAAGVEELALYVREAARRLALTETVSIMNGELGFPDPRATLSR